MADAIGLHRACLSGAVTGWLVDTTELVSVAPMTARLAQMTGQLSTTLTDQKILYT